LGVTSAICGSKNPEQAISNAKAGDISLTQDELSNINDLTNSLSVFEKV
jgi:aryl-alcohol dehydrogenase-like predicted oxidoreductase